MVMSSIDFCKMPQWKSETIISYVLGSNTTL